MSQPTNSWASFDTFEGWVKWVFGHPFGKLSERTPQPTSQQALAYMTMLFEQPQLVLNDYSDAQLNQGFWFLASNANSRHFYAFTDLRLPKADRLRGVRSIETLFVDIFAKRCTRHLSHIKEVGAGPLNSACYMWWDIAPLPRFRERAEFSTINQEAIHVMERCLRIDHDACRESALHGLGENHWFAPYRQGIQASIDLFLSRTPHLRTELHGYATRAREGQVQ